MGTVVSQRVAVARLAAEDAMILCYCSRFYSANYPISNTFLVREIVAK